MAADVREDARVRWATLAMAALATVALEQAVLEPGRSRAMALAWSLGGLIAPAVAGGWYLARRGGRTDGGLPALAVVLLTLFALPFAGAAVRLVLTGRTAMAEVILLAALRNLGLGLAAMAHRSVYARLSAVVSLFLVTVAAPVGGEAGIAVLAPVAGFSAAGLVWLMLIYWAALGPMTAAGSDAPRFPFAGAACVLAVFAVFGGVAAVGPTRAATALAGLVPTSGGTDWSDPDARSGVNDGDNEVGASERPQSVGFTESEVYLETDRPSLYDAFNESYGEPFRKTKQEKMMALGPQNVGEQKNRPAENLQAGREFSAVRRKTEPRPRRPGERAAKALVYVKGQTPLHLPLAAYSHFDGTTWHEEPCCDRQLGAEVEQHSKWLVLRSPDPVFFSGAVSHQVKVGTLDSSPMPLPPHLTRFRVGSVNRPDFFAWAQFGIVRMTDRTVPAGTVIDTEARTVDPDCLTTLSFLARPGDEGDLHLSFRGDYTINSAVAALARQWVAGVPEGWAQVEALIRILRREYTHDRSVTAPDDSRDVVADFLLRSRRGPDYLFASSAVVLLRSLGYPARVVSGLYAAPGRYDHRTRHTPVTGEDVHVWAEVRLPDGLWVAVEPTPGYDLLPPMRPWTGRVALALAAAARWCKGHAGWLLAATVVLGAMVVRRREACDRVTTLAFWLGAGSDPRSRVLAALWLIERRARWSGRPRPPGMTPGRWYQQFARQSGSGSALERLIRLADWAVHAPDQPGLAPPFGDDAIRRTCRAVVREWTLARFRAASSLSSRKVATT